MQKYLYSCAIFLLPFLVYFIIANIIDPYNYHNVSYSSDSPEKKIAKLIEPHLFKLIEYKNSPKKNIMLGDSRSNTLYSQLNSELWANLSFGASSLEEIIQTFWWTTEMCELDSVLLGVNFNLYNKFNSRFWIKESLNRMDNPISYAFNVYTGKSIILYAKSAISKSNLNSNSHRMSKNEFWAYQLSQTAKKYYFQYAYPERYFIELEHISEYCAKNDIKLIFWVPPTHSELQNKIEEFDLVDENEMFIENLKHFGIVFNYDYKSSLTNNSSNFTDPYHYSKEVARTIYSDIFGNHLSPYVRVYTP